MKKNRSYILKIIWIIHLLIKIKIYNKQKIITKNKLFLNRTSLKNFQTKINYKKIQMKVKKNNK